MVFLLKTSFFVRFVWMLKEMGWLLEVKKKKYLFVKVFQMLLLCHLQVVQIQLFELVWKVHLLLKVLVLEFFQQFVCFGHRGQKILRNRNFATVTPFTLLTLCCLKIKSLINFNFTGRGREQIDHLDIPKSLKCKLKKSTSHKTKKFANSSANKMGRYKERYPLGFSTNCPNGK